jgi:hypothetical protein
MALIINTDTITITITINNKPYHLTLVKLLKILITLVPFNVINLKYLLTSIF